MIGGVERLLRSIRRLGVALQRAEHRSAERKVGPGQPSKLNDVQRASGNRPRVKLQGTGISSAALRTHLQAQTSARGSSGLHSGTVVTGAVLTKCPPWAFAPSSVAAKTVPCVKRIAGLLGVPSPLVHGEGQCRYRCSGQKR